MIDTHTEALTCVLPPLPAAPRLLGAAPATAGCASVSCVAPTLPHNIHPPVHKSCHHTFPPRAFRHHHSLTTHVPLLFIHHSRTLFFFLLYTCFSTKHLHHYILCHCLSLSLSRNTHRAACRPGTDTYKNRQQMHEDPQIPKPSGRHTEAAEGRHVSQTTGWTLTRHGEECWAGENPQLGGEGKGEFHIHVTA